ncbi:alpha/beta hydrolase [Aquimonas sp.]|jgi:pimeloyl-ACP methyl ester carboxylesterase|uniref:alpha/beta hydrolase n=1 Tax=Aquimonas sp. TaxID=1872588 RepID=UPI0037C0BA8F
MKKFLFTAITLLLLLAIGIEPLLQQFRYDIETYRLEGDTREAGRTSREVRCWFSDGWLERSDCAWLYPSLQGESRTALPLVLLRAGLIKRSQAVTVYLSGGPGSSSYLYQEAMPYWREWMQRLDLDHDLVLYDQRGTGYAVPRLGCGAADSEYLHQLITGVSAQDSWARLMPLMEACATEVPEAERRQGLYSTRTAAQDLRELVQALHEEFGYTEVRLYGVSYGSRLAQVMLSEPLPEVSRVVLDGFYPAGVDLQSRFADDFVQILDAMERECAQRSGCAPAPSGLRGLLDAAMQRLDDSMQRVVLAEPLELQGYPEDGSPVRELQIRAETVLSVIESELTAGKGYAELHMLLEQAADGRFDEVWPSVLTDWLWLMNDPEFSTLAQALIECRDNPPVRREQQAELLARHPQWRAALELPEVAYQFCGRLGVRAEPLAASVIEQPVLLLAAEFDPRTPTTPALQAAQSFPQLSRLVLPRSGHGLTDLDDCAARQVGLFLNSGLTPQPQACH